MQDRHLGLVEQADLAFSKGEYNDAIALYTKAIKSLPANSAAIAHCEFSKIASQFNIDVEKKPAEGESLLQKTKVALDGLFQYYNNYLDANAGYEVAGAKYQIAFAISKHFTNFSDMFYNIDRLKEALELLASCQKLYSFYANNEEDLFYVNKLKNEINIIISTLYAKHAIYHLEQIDKGKNRETQIKNANKAYQTSIKYLQNTLPAPALKSKKTQQQYKRALKNLEMLPEQIEFKSQLDQITSPQDDLAASSKNRTRLEKAKPSTTQTRKRKTRSTPASAKQDHDKRRRVEPKQITEQQADDLPNSSSMSLQNAPVSQIVTPAVAAPVAAPQSSIMDPRLFSLKKRFLASQPSNTDVIAPKPSPAVQAVASIPPQQPSASTQPKPAPVLLQSLPSSSEKKSRLDKLLSECSQHQTIFPRAQLRPAKSSAERIHEKLQPLLARGISKEQMGCILEAIANFTQSSAIRSKNHDLASACLFLHEKASLLKSRYAFTPGISLESFKQAFLGTFGVGDYFKVQEFTKDPNRTKRYRSELQSSNNEDFFKESIKKFMLRADMFFKDNSQQFCADLIKHLEQTVLNSAEPQRPRNI